MKSLLTSLGLLLAATATAALAETTDFGVRVATAPEPGNPVMLTRAASVTQVAPAVPTVSLSAAVAVASRLGRVTSTRRSAARNRAVGGVPNSFHLRGRAIDVVPRPGVRHADIAAALRRAGFSLIESLDEGDHSHFAFGTAPAAMVRRETAPVGRKEVTQWRMVTAPRLASR